MELNSRFAALMNGNGDGHGDALSCSAVDLAAEARETLRSSPGLEGRNGNSSKTPQARSTSPAGLAPGKEERDTGGRFAEGNKGGPGNPYNRRVAMLKKWLLEEVSEERIKRIGNQLMDMAEAGDVAAARVLFQYVLPRNVEPDRVDMDEWEILKQAGGLFGELPGMMNKPEAGLPLKMVRAARPMMTESVQKMTANLLSTPQEKVGEVLDLLKNDPKGAREYLDRPSPADSERLACGFGGKKRGRKGKAKRAKR